MSCSDVSQGAVDAPTDAESLSLAQTITFTRLLSVLKHDILLVQPSSVSTDEAPLVLPPTITTFIAASVEISEQSVHGFWTLLKNDIWNLSEQKLSDSEEELFRQHGWKLGISNKRLHHEVLKSAHSFL
jgi:hypothetical protein